MVRRLRPLVVLGVILVTPWLGGCHREEDSSADFSPEQLRSLEDKASRGDAESEYLLGVIQQQGLGLPIDMSKAIACYKRAAAHGHGSAETRLGRIYEQGEGVPENAAEAAGWYQRAADRGLTAAQFYLATLYQRGRGVTQDPVQALKWFLLASEGSPHVKEANFAAEELMATLSPDQTAEARRLADHFTLGGSVTAASPQP